MAKKNKAPAVKGKKGVVKADKRTMNFMRRKKKVNGKKMVVVAILLIIVLGVFAKFGIIDQLETKAAAYGVLASKQDQLAAMSGRLSEYNDLAALYAKYSYGMMTDEEVKTANRYEILDLVQTEVASKASIENMSINNNMLSLNIYGVTLEQASEIVGRLESSPYVASASVNSATASDGNQARIFISVTISDNVKEAE